MTRFIILTFLVCSQLSAFAQSDSIDLNEPFIYLFNGTLIAADDIIYEEKLLAKNYLSVDSKKYEVKNVKFFSNSSGFYANSSKFFVGDYVERIHKGKANVYMFESSMTTTRSGQGGYTTTSTQNTSSLFYNIGFGDLKKVKYSNLKLDLTDNAAAMVHLNKYKRTRNIKRGLLIGGAVMMLSTLVTADIEYVGAGLATVGATSILTGVFWGMGRDKHLYRALESYGGFTF